eukprot:GHVS01094066.1.p1 GENE.GHVS01094066.1~~GHVS01094066.1.p1  ORF type:complete len:407 (+),score=37.30 GHVS01094066.1:3-1223(+)
MLSEWDYVTVGPVVADHRVFTHWKGEGGRLKIAKHFRRQLSVAIYSELVKLLDEKKPIEDLESCIKDATDNVTKAYVDQIFPPWQNALASWSTSVNLESMGAVLRNTISAKSDEHFTLQTLNLKSMGGLIVPSVAVMREGKTEQKRLVYAYPLSEQDFVVVGRHVNELELEFMHFKEKNSEFFGELPTCKLPLTVMSKDLVETAALNAFHEAVKCVGGEVPCGPDSTDEIFNRGVVMAEQGASRQRIISEWEPAATWLLKANGDRQWVHEVAKLLDKTEGVISFMEQKWLIKWLPKKQALELQQLNTPVSLSVSSPEDAIWFQKQLVLLSEALYYGEGTYTLVVMLLNTTGQSLTVDNDKQDGNNKHYESEQLFNVGRQRVRQLVKEHQEHYNEITIQNVQQIFET